MSSVSSAYDADELGQYRSLSTPAVISLLLGLCSAVAFVSPLLVVVPLAAVALGILALQGIAKSEGGLTGGRLARCGVALAILFTVGSFTRVKVRDAILERQADFVARQWLTFASKGLAEEMLQWTSQSAVGKLTPSIEQGEPMPYFGGLLAAALVRSDPYIASLQDFYRQDEFDLELQDAEIIASSIPMQAFLRYSIPDTRAEQKAFVVRLKRFRMTNEKKIWLVDSWARD